MGKKCVVEVRVCWGEGGAGQGRLLHWCLVDSVLPLSTLELSQASKESWLWVSHCEQSYPWLLTEDHMWKEDPRDQVLLSQVDLWEEPPKWHTNNLTLWEYLTGFPDIKGIPDIKIWGRMPNFMKNPMHCNVDHGKLTWRNPKLKSFNSNPDSWLYWMWLSLYGDILTWIPK